MFNFILLKDLMWILELVGISSINVRKSLKKLHKIYHIILVSYSTIFVSSELIELKFLHGLNEYTHNIAFMIVFVETWLKFLIFTFSDITNKIDDIYKFEQEIIIDQEDSNIVIIYKKYMKIFNRMFRVLVVTICSVGTSMSIRPLLVDTLTHRDALYDIVNNSTIVYRKRPLPVKTWLPFDVYKYYYKTFLFQFGAIAITTGSNIATDGCLIGFMLFASARAKILQYNLSNVRKDYPLRGIINEEVKLKFDKQYIRKCVIEHQKIISFVNELNKSMSIFMLSHFIGCSIQIAITAFWIIVDKSTILGVAIIYLSAIFIQLFVLYGIANIVTTEFNNIALGIWKSKWYECSISDQRSLQLIMVRTQKPVYLTIGPLYAMSNETALMIVKGAYSYVTVFINAYKN